MMGYFNLLNLAVKNSGGVESVDYLHSSIGCKMALLCIHWDLTGQRRRDHLLEF